MTEIKGFAGELHAPGDPAYDQHRSVWNLMHDRRPALIARCTSAADVAAALAHGRDHGLRIAVRCGGHSLPGHSTVEDGLVLDLRPLGAIEVDPDARTIRVQGGALLGDVDREGQAHGLVVPVGVVSHTGVGGLTLGGGVGRLMRRFGLTVDSLLEAEVVVPDGRILRVSEQSEPELFWGLRGGGGNFGVVTEFLFRAHALSGLLVLSCMHPLDAAPQLLRAARERMADPATPDELLWTSFLRKPPPGVPFSIPGLEGQPVAMSLIEWSGELEEGRLLLEQIRREIEPPAWSIDEVSYLAMQTFTDAMLAPGTLHAYVKAGFAAELDDEFIAALQERARLVGSDMSVIEVLSMGGAIRRPPPTSTAFPYRDAQWLINIPAQWRDAADTESELAWCRETYAALSPHLSGGAYSNFMNDDEQDPAATAYGDRQERLSRLKAAYDPENLLSLNQNIRPAVPA